MPSPDERQAKALEGILQALRESNRVMIAMNENIVTLGKTFQKWLEIEDEPTQKPPSANPNIWPDFVEKGQDRMEMFKRAAEKIGDDDGPKQQ